MPSITPQRPVPRLALFDPRLLRIEGEYTLLQRFEEPLRRALGGRRAYCEVQIHSLGGRRGEVIISIAGTKGRVPLILGQDQLEPDYVVSVVRDTVEKHDL